MSAGEQGQRYAGPIIDAHIHLWSLADDKYPWLMPGGSFGPEGMFDSLKHDYLLDDYRRDIAGQGVVASVHIEALWDVEDGQANETRWLDSLDKSDHLAIRYTAGVPFGRPDTLDLIREQASFSRVKAIRQTIAYNPDPKRTMVSVPELTRTPAFREAAGLIAELGLALELLLFPWQSDEVAELAQAFPDLTIIVNHLGSPIDQSPQGLEAWRGDVLRMATQPNVLMKVSSIAGYVPEPTLEKLTALGRHVIDAFGADRIMIASDFPPGGLAGYSYAEMYDIYRSIASAYAPEQQHAMFCGTAARVYDIDVRALTAPA